MEKACSVSVRVSDAVNFPRRRAGFEEVTAWWFSGGGFACEKFHKLLFFKAEMEQDPPSAGSRDPRPPDEDPLGRLAQHSGGIGSMGAAGKYVGVGLQFALSILLFLYLGQWLDRRIGTNGIFALVGAFLGFGAAFYSIYRSLMADQKREEEAEARKRAEAKRTGAGS